MDFNKLLKEIESFDSISLFRHINPDFDAYGSQLGLAQIIKDNFPKKQLTIHGSFSDELGTKIFAHDFNRKNKDLSQSLAIVLDTGNAPRVDDPNWDKAKKIIKFDHHPEVKEEITTNGYVNTDWSATAEGLVEFAEAANLKITKEAAKWLYIGLIGDNGRFMYPSSTAKSLRMGAALLDTGLNKDEIHNLMYTRTLEDWKSSRELMNMVTIDRGVANITLPNDWEETHNTGGDFAKKNINIMSGIEGVNVWTFVFYSKELDLYKISIRARGVVCNDILYDMNVGGGHKYACAARHKDMKVIDEVIEKLKVRVKETV